MPYVAAHPYEKDISCLNCGKTRTVIVINKVPKTCCDECRIERNQELQKIWMALNSKRIMGYRQKAKRLRKTGKYKYYCAKRDSIEEPQSLLIR